MKYTIEFKQKVCEIYKTHTLKDTMTLTGLKSGAIMHTVKQAGVIRTREERIERSRKSVNNHYFDVIDNEHKAYWLGFLYADGCISSNRPIINFTLNDKDINHIKAFKQDIESEHKISVRQLVCPKSNKLTVAATISFTSYNMREQLIAKGCVPKKSLILKFPDKSIFTNSDLVRHFIRGYFDGDGSVFISMEKHWRCGTITPVIHYRFAGTKEFLEAVRDEINLGGRITLTKKDHLYELAYKRRKKLFDFYKYLYKGATIWLPRKRDIFEKHIEEKCSETVISQLKELKGQSGQG